jgi:dihydropteroate synthase
LISKSINIDGTLLSFDKPKVMGILNITPDSFYDGSKHNTIESALNKCSEMIAEGADIIDIGAQSTRPASTFLTAKDEIERLESILPQIVKHFPNVILSIDTFYASVVEYAINEGVHVVNDISGGSIDDEMFETIAKQNVPYILSHIKGTPQTMNSLAQYANCVQEIIEYFALKIEDLHNKNVFNIIIDPGIGFAKTVDHNFEVLQHLASFEILNYPIMIGVSRKSFISNFLNTSKENSLSACSAIHALALNNGANLLRVHDVKEAVECIKLYEKLKIV